MHDGTFQRRTHDLPHATCAPVCPDGCRDMVIIRRGGNVKNAMAENHLAPFRIAVGAINRRMAG
jgi:hypothetical protein